MKTEIGSILKPVYAAVEDALIAVDLAVCSVHKLAELLEAHAKSHPDLSKLSELALSAATNTLWEPEAGLFEIEKVVSKLIARRSRSRRPGAESGMKTENSAIAPPSSTLRPKNDRVSRTHENSVSKEAHPVKGGKHGRA